VTVHEGYESCVLYAWGDPISNGPAFKQDASNTAAEQERQAGMHHDAIHFFFLW
jgi:secreted PhoX family phosphatase